MRLKLLSELDDALSLVENSAEKCRHMASEIYESMHEEKEDYQKLYHYDQYSLMSDIVFDYAVKVDEEMEAVRKICDELLKTRREEQTTARV